MRRLVAAVAVAAIAGAMLILSGYVAYPKDVEPILRLAESVVGSRERVINTLQIGGVQQVQLNVVVAQVERNELRRMSFDFINAGQHHIFSSTVGGAFIVPSTGIFP